MRWSAPWDEGSHNREVYGGLLGLTDDELDALQRGGRRMSRVDRLRRGTARRAPERRRCTLEPGVRAELVDRLAAAGLPRIEAVSFVNPARVPQMAGAEEVVAALERRPGVVYAGLVLNERGYDRLRADRARRGALRLRGDGDVQPAQPGRGRRGVASRPRSASSRARTRTASAPP